MDRFSVVGYLAKQTTDPWCLPFTKDVTVTVTAHSSLTDQNYLLFTQKIPANTVSGVHTYRYNATNSGIQELLLQENRSTDTAFYVFVDKINMLASQRAAFGTDAKGTAAYHAFVNSIDSFTIDFQTGTGTSAVLWEGSTALSKGTYTTVKQELVYGR